MSPLNLERAVLELATDSAKFNAELDRAKQRVVDLEGKFAQTSQKAQGFGSTIETAAGTFAGFVSAQAVLGGLSAGFQAIGSTVIGMNSTLEKSTLQFTTLMGNSDKAKSHVKDLFEFAKKTPFETGPVIEASRMLQTFGGEALNTKANLTLLGNASAATGAPINELGFWVGRLYSNLKGGQPFGEAAMRLQELAVMTPEARQQMEAMQKSGASAAQIFETFSGTLGKFNGAMEAQAATWEGVTSTFKDTTSILVAGAFEPLFGALRDSIGALNDWLSSDSVQGFSDWFRGGLTDAIGVASDAFTEFKAFLDRERIPQFLGVVWQETAATVKGAVNSIVEDAQKTSKVMGGDGSGFQKFMVEGFMADVWKYASSQAGAWILLSEKVNDYRVELEELATFWRRWTEWRQPGSGVTADQSFYNAIGGWWYGTGISNPTPKSGPGMPGVNPIYIPSQPFGQNDTGVVPGDYKPSVALTEAQKKAAKAIKDKADKAAAIVYQAATNIAIDRIDDVMDSFLGTDAWWALTQGAYSAGLPKGGLLAPSGFTGNSDIMDPAVQQAFAFQMWSSGIDLKKLNAPPSKSAGLGAAYSKYMPAISTMGGLLLSVLGDGKAAGAVGGALTGAGTGAMIGSLFGPGPGTAIGAGIGALVGGISGLFVKSATKKKNEEATKAIQDTKQSLLEAYGSLDAIKKLDKQLNTDLAGAWYSQGTQGLQDFNAALTQFNKGLEKNQALINALSALKPGETLAKSVRDMIASGTLTDEAKAAIGTFRSGQATTIADQIKAYLEGGGSLEGAQGRFLFSAASGAAGEMRAQGASFSDIAAAFPGLGQLSGASGMSTKLVDTINQAARPEIAAILKDSDQNRIIAASLANLGLMNQETFDALTTGLEDSYAKLVAGGVKDDETKAMLQQNMQQAWEMIADYSLVADDATRAMLDNAEKSGIVGEAFRTKEDQLAAALAENTNAIRENTRARGGETAPSTTPGIVPVDESESGTGGRRIYHRGGLVEPWGGFGTIARAHSGLFVGGAALQADEVPLIAQTGEGILSRVGMWRGERLLDALNGGLALSGDPNALAAAIVRGLREGGVGGDTVVHATFTNVQKERFVRDEILPELIAILRKGGGPQADFRVAIRVE